MAFAPPAGGRHCPPTIIYPSRTPLRRSVPSPPVSTPPAPPPESSHATVGGFGETQSSSFVALSQSQVSITGARSSLSSTEAVKCAVSQRPGSPLHDFPITVTRPSTTSSMAVRFSSTCSVNGMTPKSASFKHADARVDGIQEGLTAALATGVDGTAVIPKEPPQHDEQRLEDSEQEQESDESAMQDHFPEPELLRTFRDKCSPINGVAFSPDMQCMYTSSDDCSLHIYSLQKGVCTRVLHANKYGVHNIRILPHSLVHHVSSSSASSPSSSAGGAGPHGLQQPHLQPPPGGAAGVTCLCLCGTRASSAPAASSPPNTHAVGANRTGAPAASGVKAQAGKGKAAEGAAEPGPGRPPATSGYTAFAVRLWDLAENRYVRTFPLNGKVCRGNGLCLHPQRNTFACCSEDAMVRLFALDKEQPLWSRAVATSTPLAAFDSEGLVLAVYEGQGDVTFFDGKHPQHPFLRFSIGKLLRRRAGCGSSPASDISKTVCRRCSLPLRVKASAEDAPEGSADSHSMAKYCHCGEQTPRSAPGSPECESDFEEWPTSLLFSPDDSELVVGTSDERLLFFDSTTGEVLRVLKTQRRDVRRHAPPTASADSPAATRGQGDRKQGEPGAAGASEAGQTAASGRNSMEGRGCWAVESEQIRKALRRDVWGEPARRPCFDKRRRGSNDDGDEGNTRSERRRRSQSGREEGLERTSCTELGTGSAAAARSSGRAARSARSGSLSPSRGDERVDGPSLFAISPMPFGCSSSCPDCCSTPSSVSSGPRGPASLPVFVPAFTPCGRFLAVGGADRYVHIFDLHARGGKGKEMFALGRCESDPQFVVFNSKFDVLLTAGLNASVWRHSFSRKVQPPLTCWT
ncbi:WD domain, G-beta repeat-containing protein [Besnoitia besnoiti]|uniref:WD domain, G-beta repeat-containing protein n=1 Tax=Besnoitia besnoiti TaxID=94643 RepID=A0A2A9M651_BESBE|nr:WD domain, G-beta repeat-containing protein [Besnoitia besnoiti]PFH33445.1 WD domain, G-beta repeat-containing protein [Besnoitia besnoiti]